MHSRLNSFVTMILLGILDYLAIVSAEQCAFMLRNHIMKIMNLHISWLNFWITFPFLYMAFLNIEHLYNRRMPFYTEVERLFKACVYGAISVVMVLYVAQIAANTSRLFTFAFGIFAFIFLLVFRYATKRLLIKYHLLQVPVLVIGAGKTAELFVKAVRNDAGMGYNIVGLLEDYNVHPGILENYPLLGKFDDAERVIAETGVKRVILAVPGLDDRKLGLMIYRLQPLVDNIDVLPSFVGVPLGGVEVERFFTEKLLLLRLRNNLARPLNRWTKSAFDYVVTFFGTIAISPILIAIAIWVFIDSPGPIIFKHTRVGKNGKPFQCYKFRSMCVDADEKLQELLSRDPAARAEWEHDFKLKNDPRITRSGAFLRRTSLDELPQIFNVLKGEMSLVGPRPIIEAELERYGDYVGDYLMVKPGITGMWQVSGRSDTSYEERVMLDSWYVRNWSIWIDVVMLFKTIAVVLKRKGAY